MHLNYDCLRDVLITLEKRLEILYDGSFEFPYISVQSLMQDPEIAPYSIEDVFYCIHNLQQAEYVSATFLRSDTVVHECVVYDITYAGHMFLRSIKDETIWTMVKKKFGPAINASLPVVQQIAAKCILLGLGLSV